MSFRRKTFFITSPNSVLSPETVLSNLLSAFPVSSLCIVRERHLSGEPHLHALLVLSTVQRIQPSSFDHAFGKHVNIQDHVRKAQDVLKYILKESPKDSTWEIVCSARFSHFQRKYLISEFLEDEHYIFMDCIRELSVGRWFESIDDLSQ